MKTFKLLLIGIIFIAFGCTDPLDPYEDLETTPEYMCDMKNPLCFVTAFQTVEVSRTEMYPCGDPGWWAFEAVTEGHGIAKYLGKTTAIKSMTVTGCSFRFPFYTDTHTAYISANKDTLMFRTSTEIYQDSELGWPYTVAQNFQVEFLYGTGTFANATDGEIEVVNRKWNDETREGTLTERVIIYF